MTKYQFTSLQKYDCEEVLFDLVITCLGYESRAITIAQTFFNSAIKRVALGFDRQKILAYPANETWFYENNFETFQDVTDAAFEITVTSLLTEVHQKNPNKELKIGIDISCFDRYRLAVLTRLMAHDVSEFNTQLYFFYCIAEYVMPSHTPSVNARLQPVHPSFVGSRPDPLSAIATVIGLGYELEKAVGAAEYLEAKEVFSFCPSSSIKEYLPSVKESNQLLLSQLDNDHNIVYEVEQPARLISDLSSIVKGLLNDTAVIMIPLGPKIFALCTLLTAILFPAASVWRMNQGTSTIPVDRKPSKALSILTMVKR